MGIAGATTLSVFTFLGYQVARHTSRDKISSLIFNVSTLVSLMV